jgi:LysM repeat protein
MQVRRGAGGTRVLRAMTAIAAMAGALLLPKSADAAVPHVVASGETLWSIAAANNLTTRTVAVFNGLSEDAVVVEGQTIDVPTVDEGAVALANAGITPGAPSESGAAAPATGETGADHTVVAGESLSSVAAANGITAEALAAANGMAADAYLIEGQTISIPAASSTSGAIPPAPGMGHVPSPYGELHLDPAAADSWNSMREESVASYGVDLYPGGPASAYRTPEQQAELYQQYLDGTGAPANPPGTSTHELGVAVDVPEPAMRDVIDQIGAGYGWAGTIPSEWWHVEYGG